MEKRKDSDDDSSNRKSKEQVTQLAKELHKPIKKVKVFRPVAVSGIDNTWCADLVDMSQFAKDNDGFKFMLTVIDVLSRYAWAVPIGGKSATTVLNAFKSIIETSGRQPKKLWVDQGKEFFNKKFQTYFHSLHIEAEPESEQASEDENAKDTMYHTHNVFHAAPVESFNKTLKTRMWYKFTKAELNDKKKPHRWIDRLDKLMKKYNSTTHSRIGMTPNKASEKESEPLLLRIQDNKLDRVKYIKPAFKVGDRVRLCRLKDTFEKGYTRNWTNEIFTVVRVVNSKPPMFQVKDENGENVEGSYYTEELMKSKF